MRVKVLMKAGHVVSGEFEGAKKDIVEMLADPEEHLMVVKDQAYEWLISARAIAAVSMW